MTALTGRHITIYGQQEVVKDLIAGAARPRRRRALRGLTTSRSTTSRSDTPRITLRARRRTRTSSICDAIAGCDGFHGVSRPTIAEHLTEYEYVYEFGWLGILAEARPATDELIYAWHERRLRALHDALAEDQPAVPPGPVPTTTSSNWPDDRIWGELGDPARQRQRGHDLREGHHADALVRGRADAARPPVPRRRLRPHRPADRRQGPEPRRQRRPPARAGADRRSSATATRSALDGYTTAALRRVWRAQDFSNYMTQMLHDLGGGPFQRRLQLARLEYVARSDAAARSLAENYVGLPAEPEF